MAKIIQPLIISNLIPNLEMGHLNSIAMSSAVIYEPSALNEVPLKYTAGMILAVPVDAELSNISETSKVKLAIKTPDQKIILVTPRPTDFLPKPGEEKSYRLLTNALMSHAVWSEALFVEISIVYDVSAYNLKSKKKSSILDEDDVIMLCSPVKVNVLPKAVKRGI